MALAAFRRGGSHEAEASFAGTRGSYQTSEKERGAIPVIGFAGRVSHIARVHQYGLTDRAERGAPEVRYAKREVLGLSDEDLKQLRNKRLDGLEATYAAKN